MSSYTTTINIVRSRGDNAPFNFEIDEDSADKPLTGQTFLMTVHTEEKPDAGASLFQLTGVITDGPTGKYQFLPTVGNMDLPPKKYFYDIQMTDTQIFTIVKGAFTIEQDITK